MNGWELLLTGVCWAPNNASARCRRACKGTAVVGLCCIAVARYGRVPTADASNGLEAMGEDMLMPKTDAGGCKDGCFGALAAIDPSADPT